MSKNRLRSSLFPGYAPYLNFVGPDDDYEDGETPDEDMILDFTVGKGTGPSIMDFLHKFGFKTCEVRLLRLYYHIKIIQFSGQHETSARSAVRFGTVCFRPTQTSKWTLL